MKSVRAFLDRLGGLVVRGPGSYQILWEVVGLERGPLSLLVSTIEELLERKSSGSVQKPTLRPQGILRADQAIPLYLQKLAQTSPTSGGRSVSIVRSRIKATEFVCFPCIPSCRLHDPGDFLWYMKSLRHLSFYWPQHRNLAIRFGLTKFLSCRYLEFHAGGQRPDSFDRR
jgi:hypothetical protein